MKYLSERAFLRLGHFAGRYRDVIAKAIQAFWPNPSNRQVGFNPISSRPNVIDRSLGHNSRGLRMCEFAFRCESLARQEYKNETTAF